MKEKKLKKIIKRKVFPQIYKIHQRNPSLIILFVTWPISSPAAAAAHLLLRQQAISSNSSHYTKNLSYKLFLTISNIDVPNALKVILTILKN